MEERYYYEKPFQVIFLRDINGVPTYEKGIAFKNWIIAARDGEVFYIDNILFVAVYYFGIDEDYAIVEGMEWLPIEIN